MLDHADVVLDLCTPPGDAMVGLDGVATPVGPGVAVKVVPPSSVNDTGAVPDLMATLA